MEPLDFRKRLRFSAPEIAATPESKLMRDLVVNLRKLDDLGLADDYIKRAVLEKYSRESNVGDFGLTLGQDPMPMQHAFKADKAEPVKPAPEEDVQTRAKQILTELGLHNAHVASRKGQSQQADAQVNVAESAPIQVVEPQAVEVVVELESFRHDQSQEQAPGKTTPMVDEVVTKADPPARIPRSFQVM